MEGEEKEVVYYYSGTSIPLCKYYLKGGLLHKIDGPASMLFEKDGKITSEEYYVAGYQTSKNYYEQMHKAFSKNDIKYINKLLSRNQFWEKMIIYEFAKFYKNNELIETIERELVINKLEKN